MAALIVTYDQAVDHLRSQGVGDVSDLNLKLQQANDIVFLLLKREDESPAWSEETDPDDDSEFSIAQALVLKVLANLYRYRGDDDKPVDPIAENDLMIRLLRDPTIA